jgi:ribosomal protein S18 acetylase RimI-like enzyme
MGDSGELWHAVDVTVTRRAVLNDEPVLLVLIREFYEIDRHDFDQERVVRGLRSLLTDDSFGQVRLVTPGGNSAEGYVVVTWSWSLESGGRDCILDELYVRRRGEGIGAAALDEAVEAAAEAGAQSMFLETEAHNSRVRPFYARAGFRVEDSVWMVRELSPSV